MSSHPLRTAALLVALCTAASAQFVITEFPGPVSPYCITAGPDGNLWFTDEGANKVGRITPAGVITEFSAGITAGANPFGIAAGPDGNLWFTELAGNRIGRVTPAGVITEFTTGLVANGGPYLITAGPDGAMWFTDSNGPRIGRITTAGVITEFTNGLVGSSQLFGIISGPDGALWFTQANGNKVGRITTAGAVTLFSTGISAASNPEQIAAGPDGNLWFPEGTGNRIARVTTAGVVTEFSAGLTAGSFPAGIAAGPDGALWFTEDGGSRIGRITTAGVITEYSTGLTPASAPFGITAGPDGNMWFGEDGGGRIGRITTPAPVPVITFVANAEGENPVIAANTWVEIKSSGLAPAGDSRIWQGSDFVNNQMPTQLDGVGVTVNGKAAYVYYISPAQVNILTPPDLVAGPLQVQVNVKTASGVLFNAQPVAAESTSFFVFNGGPYVAATHADGSLIGPATLYPGFSTPAQAGETIVIYGNGFGPISNAIVNGASSQSGTLNPLPVITIAGQTAEIKFAGINGAPGEFQLNVVIPLNTPSGDQPIGATHNTFASQAGTLITVK
jgi:uncharacterized protein (TIGR03437 family)